MAKAEKTDLKALFGAAQAATVVVDKAEKALNDATIARSNAVQALVNGAGGKKGPFRLPNGGLAMVRCRKSFQKDDDGEFVLDEKKQKIQTGETWFFVTMSESEAIEI